ncbi:fic/DOC family protein [bacterium BMS3Abin15]|nr:fic/DOC family protein [bacterium BMS3Abin15]
MKKVSKKKNKLVIYQANSGAIELKGDFQHETIWATQAQMASVFGVNSQAITKHLKNIYEDTELAKKATCSKVEQVQIEGRRKVKRFVEVYNLDAIISVGYRISSKTGTKFRQWATKVLRQHITKGYTINPKVIKNNYAEFQKAIENIKHLLPSGANTDHESVLELVSAFADTWLSLDAYDKDMLVSKGATKKEIKITAEKLAEKLANFKNELIKKKQATDLFGRERQPDAVAGIFGNVMQSFGGKPVYPTVEEKAAHLLYFMVKNHPFVDGNKRSGAFAFVWFLKKAGILNMQKITPAALTALTLFIAESAPKNKERMIRLVLQILKK